MWLKDAALLYPELYILLDQHDMSRLSSRATLKHSHAMHSCATEVKCSDQNFAMQIRRPLLPLAVGAREPRPNTKCHNRRLSCVAAVVVVLLNCACGLLAHAAAQEVASGSLGIWSAATLSVGRYALAATSLPNQGLAIFAGGWGRSRDYCCSDCKKTCCEKMMHKIHVWEECDVMSAL